MIIKIKECLPTSVNYTWLLSSYDNYNFYQSHLGNFSKCAYPKNIRIALRIKMENINIFWKEFPVVTNIHLIHTHTSSWSPFAPLQISTLVRFYIHAAIIVRLSFIPYTWFITNPQGSYNYFHIQLTLLYLNIYSKMLIY